MSIDSKDLLRQLIRIPSVNPAFGDPAMGATDDTTGEGRLTDFLQDFFEKLGCLWLRQTVHPGRDNLIALLFGNSSAKGRGGENYDLPKPITLWEVHQDTVGVANMNVEPFGATEAQERLYGRGACDVKGAMAAMLAAFADLASRGDRLQGTHLLAFTVNEESGFTGARALGQVWSDRSEAALGIDETTGGNCWGSLPLEQLKQMRPDQVLVCEPTNLQVVVSHKGIVRWKCVVHGRAAHSSQPERGENAIYGMSEVVAAIRAYDRDVLSQRGSDSMCGRPTCCVTTMHAGLGTNTVPDQAVIDIDRRLLPEEHPAEAYQELIETVAATVGSQWEIEHQVPWNESRGLSAENNRPWAEQVARVVRSGGRDSQLVGVPFGTDAWVFGALGIPTVVFGPGSIEQAHTEDEWLALDQLESATDVFRRLALGK